MSMDNSLKVKAGMAGVRSVQTRAERIAKMLVEKKFDTAKSSPLGIPKTRLKVIPHSRFCVSCAESLERQFSY